jgi:hypothetical protein
MGPLLTLAVFNVKKGSKVLRRDLVVIGLFQLAALGYGLWTVAVVRPVHLVFEIDRFRAVHAIEVPRNELGRAPAGLGTLPLTGPTLLSVRDFKDDKERSDITFDALAGLPLGTRPGFWQRYDQGKPQVLARARPLEELKKRFPDKVSEIDASLKWRAHRARAVPRPDYIDDPVLVEYVQGIWQPLLAPPRVRGELTAELDERFAWQVLLGKDRTINAFALPGGWLGPAPGPGQRHRQPRRTGLGAGARTEPRHAAPHLAHDGAGEAADAR